MFLWIPSARTFQTHPFTLVSNNPAEFVVSVKDGFTKDVYDLALRDPKAMHRASVEGAYGHVPDPSNFDKVILLSGSSGATFTLALAMDWMRRTRRVRGKRPLEFVWAVKTMGMSHPYWAGDTALTGRRTS